MSTNQGDLIAVAKGDMPADLVISNAKIVNVFSGEIEPGNVAVYKGRIAGIGDYTKANKVIDLDGKYLAPGLINGHTHIESSMVDIGQYARTVVQGARWRLLPICTNLPTSADWMLSFIFSAE
jgi:adenine deaminase